MFFLVCPKICVSLYNTHTHAHTHTYTFMLLWLFECFCTVYFALQHYKRHCISIMGFQCHNWGDALRAIARPLLIRNLPFLKEHKDKIVPFGLPHFVFFILFPAVEEFYHKSILVKMFIQSTINIYDESFGKYVYSVVM